jgi:hypothetical protein
VAKGQPSQSGNLGNGDVVGRGVKSQKHDGVNVTLEI